MPMLVQIIKVLYDEFMMLWETRNKSAHNETNTQKSHAIKQKIMYELHQVYEAKEKVLARDRNFFYDSPETHFNHHKSVQQILN